MISHATSLATISPPGWYSHRAVSQRGRQMDQAPGWTASPVAPNTSALGACENRRSDQDDL